MTNQEATSAIKHMPWPHPHKVERAIHECLDFLSETFSNPASFIIPIFYVVGLCVSFHNDSKQDNQLQAVFHAAGLHVEDQSIASVMSIIKRAQTNPAECANLARDLKGVCERGSIPAVMAVIDNPNGGTILNKENQE